ncbi:MAG: adenosylcobinamide-GDP ribazoletransferase [Clostridia bacterium]|nr:adenosylcobinamide-GDP ribazoletransferase [Clostridia bacterium]
MKLWFYAFFMAWGMFLSVPCPFPKWDEKARGRMLACLPLIGVLVGAVWALAAFLLARFACPKPLAAFVLAMLPYLLVGFLHLDGFSDVCDAILSRCDLEMRQRILKDPHIGAFGVISIVILLIARFALFLSADAPALSFLALLPLALIPIATRACAFLAVALLRPMKTSQYARMDRGEAKKHIVLPSVMLAAAIALPLVFCGFHGFAPLAAAVFYALNALRGYKSLDGMNGDISGYALELGELFGIAAFVLIR